MPENQDPENTPYTPPWRPALQESPDQTEPTIKSTGARILNKKLLILVIAILVVLLGFLTFVLVPDSLISKRIKGVEKLKETLPFVQDKKYETTFYEVSLPKDWSVSVRGVTITASDPERPIREVTISTKEYSQTLVDNYKHVGVKDPYVYHVRYLTAECHIDKTKGEYCDRTYYVWNEDQKMMATVKIQWEELSIAEAAKTYEGLKKAQSEGLPKAHPSIETMEKKIFSSFQFKTT